MFKLLNTIQNYSWGSKSAFNQLFGYANPDHQPQAELWMGAHPRCSSVAITPQGNFALAQLIADNPQQVLGKTIAARYAELPFLFKLLSAGEPLSIQVHPDKKSAEQGYDAEQAAGVALDAAQRNYKDRNHKPELIYALTPFIGMNGFRPIPEILSLFATAEIKLAELTNLQQQQTPEALLQLFKAILTLTGEAKRAALQQLQQSSQLNAQPWQSIRFIQQYYPEDNGLFCPLLLNVVELQPGEAMYLDAQTPHAYLYGTGLEIMANSDNVLRAGLTPKHIDIGELMRNIQAISHSVPEIILHPTGTQQSLNFPIPIADFAFSIHTIENSKIHLTEANPSILFCIEGEVNIHNSEQTLTLQKGESCFITVLDYPIRLTGSAKVAAAYTKA